MMHYEHVLAMPVYHISTVHSMSVSAELSTGLCVLCVLHVLQLVCRRAELEL
jgi:hypothetical protein